MDNLSVSMLNVGNADALVIYFEKNGKKKLIVVDSGKNADDAELIITHINQVVKSEYYKGISSTIYPDIVLLTHSDKDHMGGIERLYQEYGKTEDGKTFSNTKFLIINPKKHIHKEARNETKVIINESVKALTDFLEKNTANLNIITQIHDIKEELKNTSLIQMLSPSIGKYYELVSRFKEIKDSKEQVLLESKNNKNKTNTAENDASIVFLLTFTPSKADFMDKYKTRNFLFTGDAGLDILSDVNSLNGINIKNLFFLKYPHHGRTNVYDKELIKELNPDYVFISGEKQLIDTDLLNQLTKKAYISTDYTNYVRLYYDSNTKTFIIEP